MYSLHGLKFSVVFGHNHVFGLLVIMQKPWQLIEQQLWLMLEEERRDTVCVRWALGLCVHRVSRSVMANNVDI